MTTNTIQVRSSFRAVHRHRGGLLAWARLGIAGWRHYQHRRLAIRELSRMSDWRLQDMGIPRGRIAEVVDGLIAREGPAAGGPAS